MNEDGPWSAELAKNWHQASVIASVDDVARKALEHLPLLKGCDAHSTVLLSSVDIQIFKKLGINLTCEPKYEENGRVFHKH